MAATMTAGGLIDIVDDDEAVRDSLEALLLAAGFETRSFASAESYLDAAGRERACCCLLDVRMPGKDGLGLLAELERQGASVPVVIMTGHGDVPMAVRAMKLGARDFIEKPFDADTLLSAVHSAAAARRAAVGPPDADPALLRRLDTLTPREREVMECLAVGCSNKEAAARLGISPRTVEIHRARTMEKMAAGNLAELVRMAIAAGVEPKARS
jgi:two-component system response regulator FixJ